MTHPRMNGFPVPLAPARSGRPDAMTAPFRNVALPTEPTISAAAYEVIVDDARENLRAAFRAAGIERCGNLIRQAGLDVFLAENDVEDPLVKAIGHVRDSEGFPPSSARKGECIHDAAVEMAHAAAEYGHGEDGL